MSWVKEANQKYKRYHESRRGFRVYMLKRPARHSYIEDREDGKYRITNFIKGEWLAINKEGIVFRRDNRLDLCDDIEFFHFGRIIAPSQEQYNPGK